MEIILKDGVKFIQHNFDRESEFEKVVLQQTKHIFGNDALLFDKQKIKTETNIGTIPDAFVVCPLSKKWYVIEVELASHSVYSHIIPQITKFKSALDNNATRKALLKYFDKEIERDLHKLASWSTATGDRTVHRLLSDIIDSEPELLIIIDAHNPELEAASGSIKFLTKINVFKTYCRENFGLGDSIYHFQTLGVNRIKNTIASNYITPLVAETKLAKDEQQVANTVVSRTANSNPIGRKMANSTPSANLWAKSVPELSSLQDLNNWRSICDHLNVKHVGDSARRALERWVKNNKPNWPPVPSI